MRSITACAVSVGAGLAVAVSGSVLIGVFECALAAHTVSNDLLGESLPLWLLAATAGKNALTHAILWTPLMMAAGLALQFIAATRSCARALLTALFVFVPGGFVLSVDLEIAHRTSLIYVISAWGVAALAAVLVFLFGRWFRRRGPTLARQLFWGASIIGVFVFVLLASFFGNSPLYDPAGWRPTAMRMIYKRPPGMNVLWIVLDTTRADRMTHHGYDRLTTPYLTGLTTQTLVCDRTIANGMWTVPSHAAMFTGRSAREHGTGHRNLNLDDSFETVAETLQQRGYATAAFSNNPLVSPRTNLLQGFDTWRILYHHRQLQQFSLSYVCEREGWTPPLPWLDADYGAALANSLIEAWLNEYRGQPHLLFVNYMEAHLPYRVPRRYREMFMTPAQVARSYELRREAFGNSVSRLDRDFNISGGDFVSESDRDILRRQYDAAIRYLDDRVRELIGMYEARGLLDNTLVVIAGDHGEYLGTHEMWGHRFLAYQDLAHVTMQIRDPRNPVGRRIATPTQLSDLYATVLNAVLPDEPSHERPVSVDLLATDDSKAKTAADFGTPAKADADAADAKPATPAAAVPASASERIAICECNGPAPVTMKSFATITDPVVLHRTSPQIAAVGPRYKLLLSGDGRRELYDLLLDPAELHNVYDDLPDEVAPLEEYIAEWLERTPKYQLPAGTATPSEDMLKTLRALGYVGGEEEP